MKPTLYLINGPLGAGKTTFLRELLKNREFQKSRVIENEFASTGVDTQLLHDHQAEVQTIAGVCICCSSGDELTEALMSLANSSEPVIIEATGVANSLKLLEKLVLADVLDTYNLAHAVFILDGAEAAKDGEIMKIYENELRAADTVLISKTDLISESEKLALLGSLNELGVRYVEIVNEGIVAPKILRRPSNILAFFARFEGEIKNHDTAVNYTVVDLENAVLSSAAMPRLWESLRIAYSLKRLKGDFYSSDETLWHVEATPGQCRVTPSVSDRAQLVIIGKDARLVTKDVIKSGGASA